MTFWMVVLLIVFSILFFIAGWKWREIKRRKEWKKFNADNSLGGRIPPGELKEYLAFEQLAIQMVEGKDQCPDCLGRLRLHTTGPTGEYEHCPRCVKRYPHKADPSNGACIYCGWAIPVGACPSQTHPARVGTGN